MPERKLEEWFRNKTPAEQKMLKKMFLEELESSKIKNEYQDMLQIAKDLGYELWSHAGDKTSLQCAKNVLRDEASLHLNIYRKAEGEWRAEISNHFRSVKITSQEFAFPHPNFKDVFESQVYAAAMRCLDLHP